jgi:hypothetical protein
MNLHTMPGKMTVISSIQPSPGAAPAIERVALTVAVVATLLLVGTMLWRSHLGFDFTDEGYYLNSISNPWHFPVSPTQFGYIYHPLHQLLGRDVAALRQSNILISFCLAVLTCLCLYRRISREASAVRPWLSVSSLGVAITVASSSLLIVIFIAARWSPTPSYNSLVFQSLLVTSMGLCLAEAKALPVSLSGWALIGIGGGLAFMAKPPSAAALGVLTLCSLTIMGKLKWRMVAVSVLTSVLVVSALGWMIDGSVTKFAQDLYQSAANPGLLMGDKSVGIFRYDPVELENTDWCIMAFLTALIALLVWAANPERRGWAIAGAIASLACAVAGLAVVLGLLPPDIPSTKYQGLQFLVPVFAALLIAASMWRPRRSASPVSKQGLALALFFAGLPFACAFGSYNEYWLASSSAVFFWTLSGISMIASARPQRDIWRIMSPVAIVTLAMTAVFVYRGMITPQRQTRPLTADADAIQIVESGARLLVSHDFAEYINAALRLSRDAGFKAGTPMIDLSGQYPGTLYIIGSKPVGAPWLIGGYPGSDASVAKSLDRVSCEELAESWILAEPNGPRKLSSDILKKYGIELERDYTIVAVLDSPTGTYPDSYKQQLLKPTRTRHEAVAACELARARKG